MEHPVAGFTRRRFEQDDDMSESLARAPHGTDSSDIEEQSQRRANTLTLLLQNI
jgi:hypothetical protein